MSLLTDLIGNIFTSATENLPNLIGAAGQIAATEDSISRLRDLGAEGKQTIGMPTGSLYDTVAGATQFKPFTVTSLPGSVATTAQGGTTFDLSPEQRAMEQSLRTGGSSLLGDVTFGLSPEQTALEQSLRRGGQSLYDIGIMGRGQGAIDPATGLPTDDARAGQADLISMLELSGLDASGRSYRGQKQDEYVKAFHDPFKAPALAAGEQTLFDRLREIRMPEEERARVALQQQLVAGGRQGLQTAQYGGSPESFALNKAIEEQKSQDAIAAMNFARQDAQLLSDANLRAIQEGRTDQELASATRLRALQQQMQEKQTAAQIAEGMIAGSYRPTEARLAQTQIAGNLADQMLASSYRPSQALIAQMQPSLNLADIATVAGRQLGGYGSELGRASLDYDLGAEGAAVNLRNQLLQGLFGMLTQSGQQQPPFTINIGGSGGSSGGGGMSWQDYASDILGSP